MKIVKLICLLLFGIQSVQVVAQFTYVGLGVQYNRLSIGGSYGQDNLRNSSINLPIKIGVRPIRQIELGLEVSPRIFKKYSFRFDDFSDISGSEEKYRPETIDYQLSRDVNFTISAKVFMEFVVNSYFEIGISSQNYTEEFTFIRTYKPAEYYTFGGLKYPAVPSKNINYISSTNLMVPVIAIGLKPHISNRAYFDFKIGAQFPMFEQTGFSYEIESNLDYSNDQHEYSTIASLVKDRKMIFSTEIGFGIFF